MIRFLLPFKGLSQAKSRWRLQGAERDSLLLELLDHNLRTVSQVVGSQQTYLVSPDQAILTRCHTVRSIRSQGRGLNEDLDEARRHFPPESLDGPLAVLLPDLPRLSTHDIEAMIAAAESAQVTLCPDHKQIGTNGIVLNPAFCLDFLFEGASLARFQNRADQLGRSVQLLDRVGLAQDCDEHEDIRSIHRL